jgi:hypothetical protein
MRSPLLIAALLAALLAVPGASAFEAGALELAIAPDGDATATFAYSLSWLETVGAYLAGAAPAAAVEAALSEAAGRPVTVTALDARSVTVEVPGFATATSTASGTTWTTPAYDLRRLEAWLERSPLAPLVSPDFTPSRIALAFPDGFEAAFDSTPVLPAYVHTA